MRASGAFETGLRTALWLVLGGWVGSWASFGLVVAPVVFGEAPEAAGPVIGPVLAVLHLYGGAAGLALAVLAQVRGRGWLLVILPLLMSAVCFISHFGVSAQVAELRDAAFGAGGSAEAAARFTHLHQLSLALFVGVGFATIGLVWLHARADTQEAAV